MPKSLWPIALILIAGAALIATLVLSYKPQKKGADKQIRNENKTATLFPIVRLTDPQRGPNNAELTIVFFTDFGCDACRGVWPVIQTLERDFPDRIKFVWKDFPASRRLFSEVLDLHRGGHCAAAQGKFWEYQNLVTMRYKDIIANNAVLKNIVPALGLNMPQFNDCLASQASLSRVLENYSDGQSLKITGTPTFFIGSHRLDQIVPYDLMNGLVRAEIQKARQGATRRE